MNRDKKILFCKWLHLSLLVCFIIKMIWDKYRYSIGVYTTPFYVWGFIDIVCFVVPAIIVYFVYIKLKKEAKKEKENSENSENIDKSE